MAFIMYEKNSKKNRKDSSTIGINEKGRFAFYKPVIQQYMGDKEFVELFYDPENQKIGIKPIGEPTIDAFKVQGHTTKIIMAKKFLNRFNIEIKNNRYPFKNENEMLVINLREMAS